MEPQGCSDTGKSLNTLKNVILAQWEDLVRIVIKNSQHESSIILQDHIPKLLDQLEKILMTGEVSEEEIGKNHGYFRATMTDFSVSDLMTEYALLRETLINYLYPMGDKACSALVHKFMDILMKHSVVEFLNSQQVRNTLKLEEVPVEFNEIKNNPVIPTS